MQVLVANNGLAGHVLAGHHLEGYAVCETCGTTRTETIEELPAASRIAS
ncbi:MAG: hypothetical protein GY696_16110 [Gammaproteobacteria bacterium]|nr:hypothetical protein [Gammaproteobacteria bacterium]